MLRQRTRTLITAAILPFLFATSSALGANHSRSDRTVAAGLHARHHHVRARQGRDNVAGVHQALAALTSTVLLGEEAVQGYADGLKAGQAEAFPFQARSSGATGAAHVYLDSHNTATHLMVGLYSAAGGRPASLLATGALASPHAGAWNTVTVGNVALTAGTGYWLAVLGTGGTLRYRDRLAGACQGVTSSQTNLTALAGAWRTDKAWWTCPISAYVTAGDALVPVEPAPPLEESPPAVQPPPPPPPPAAPTNTILPVISGTPTDGQPLQVSTGTWTGSPSSYVYQWQDCGSMGTGCTNVSGAASSYTLTAADVGYSVRVVVTASGVGGAASATSVGVGPVSAPPPPPPPPPPTASFSYGPTSPVVGEAIAFNGSSSTCPDGPCTYAWSDDGGPLRPIPPLWPLGSGQTLPYAFSGAGTKYVRLVVTDAAGQEATVEHNIVVESSAPPTAPSNTQPPTVSGSALVGQMLTASSGSWNGSAPISYAYQWQDCTASGESCSNIVGAASATHSVTEADVGHTLRVVVTASNAGGSTSASSAATVTVAAAPPPPPLAPVNTAAPVVSGSTVEGQTLSASQGSWSNSPTAYAYQWQDCNTVGEACANTSGATASTYELASGDVGHTIRVVVTATNGGGSAAQASAVTAKVTENVGCTTTVTSAVSAGVIASDIVGAANGSTVCLAAGSYPFIRVLGATHASYVTVRPAAGASVTVAGFEVQNSSFVRIQGLRLSAGINFRDGGTYAGSHDYQVLENTFENAVYGVVLYGGAGPVRKVLIEGNRMRNIDFPGEACAAGYGGGQGVSLYYAEGVTIAHNTFKEVSWHYIQGGSAGPEGVTVEHNLFEGPIQADRLACTHLNVWQIYQGGENDVFSNNIVRGEPGKPAAVTPLMFETGAAGQECGDTMTNTTVTNNLFLYASTAYVADILTTKNLVYSHNTVVGGEYGTWLDRSDSCGAGTNMTAEHNIAVKTESKGAPQRFVLGGCTGTCHFDYNASDDTTANQDGSTHYQAGWAPSWTTTGWNPLTETTPPTGYYQPTKLNITAGYEGNAGP